MDRLSSLASISVTAQLASVVIERDYASVLSAVRVAESQRAGLLAQLKRSRTPEEEASLRDKLGQAELTVQRARERQRALDEEATRLQIALARPDEVATAVTSDDSLAQAYVQTRVDLRRAQAEQHRLVAKLETGSRQTTPDQLQQAILRANDLSIRLKTLQERAGQVGVSLPVISPQEEAVMARVGDSERCHSGHATGVGRLARIAVKYRQHAGLSVVAAATAGIRERAADPLPTRSLSRCSSSG
jgi:hypothetical protein